MAALDELPPPTRSMTIETKDLTVILGNGYCFEQGSLIDFVHLLGKMVEQLSENIILDPITGELLYQKFSFDVERFINENFRNVFVEELEDKEMKEFVKELLNYPDEFYDDDECDSDKYEQKIFRLIIKFLYKLKEINSWDAAIFSKTKITVENYLKYEKLFIGKFEFDNLNYQIENKDGITIGNLAEACYRCKTLKYQKERFELKLEKETPDEYFFNLETVI